jgi:cell division protein FtsW (lipid II flippase)
MLQRGPARFTETWLLLVLTIIYLGGICLIHFSRSRLFEPSILLFSLPLLGALWCTHLILTLTRCSSDELLFPLAAFLCIIGHLLIFRLNPALAARQSLFLVIGIALFDIWYLKGFDYRIWEDYKYIILLTGIIIQIMVMIVGVEINGAKLWFRLGSFNFQPVEIVKILVVIFLASYLKQKKEFISSHPRRWFDLLSFKYLFPLMVIWGCCELVLVVQKDLGMALLLFGSFMCLFYVATHRVGMIICGFIVFLGSTWAIMHTFPHVHVRFTSWLDPWRDPDGGGYQIIQALFALTSGGFWGTGLGLGLPKFIPEVHTDFIFAALGEEMGFLGALAVLLAYLLLIQRIYKVALQCHDEFGILLASGLASLMACQTLIIIGGSTKFIPMTGITLPFISYGGSSILANFFLLALVFQVSNLSRKKKALSYLKTSLPEELR